MKLSLFKSLNMEKGTKFLLPRRKPPFHISGYVRISGFSILRKRRNQGNNNADFCFSPLLGVNHKLSRFILVVFSFSFFLLFCITEGIKLKDLAFFELVHMQFLWFFTLWHLGTQASLAARWNLSDKAPAFHHLPVSKHKPSFDMRFNLLVLH